MSRPISEFKERLQILMAERNLNQSEVAERTGIPNATISRYLSGQQDPRLLASGGYLPGGQQTFRRRMRSVLSTCGIDPKKHTPHDCRATFASRLYAAGVPDLHIKRMMGHSTGDLTKDVYTEVFMDELRKSLEKIS